MSKATKTTHTGLHKYSIPGKRASDALAEDEKELYELSQLSGIELSPAVFRILLDLLKHNVSPVAIAQVLKSMVRTKSSNVVTLVPDLSRNITDGSHYDPTSGMTTSAMSSRKGTSSVSSMGGSSSSRADLSKKGSSSARSGSSSSRSVSGRQRGDIAGSKQPKS